MGNFSLSQVQQQKLSLEQVQQQSALQVLSARLTELPLDAFRERLRNELAENPYLEAHGGGEDATDSFDGGGRVWGLMWGMMRVRIMVVRMMCLIIC